MHKYVKEVCTQAELPLVDLLPNFKFLPHEHIQVLPGSDSHPNELGHRIAADAIYKSLMVFTAGASKNKKAYQWARK